MTDRPLWRTADVDSAEVQRMAERLSVPERIARWLCSRNITLESAAAWLEPQRVPWADPGEFHDMEAAVKRIIQSVIAGERICIVGDYDVDGVTSSTILASTLEVLGANWQCIIPHRIQDGYGLSTKLVDRALSLGSQLIVTVDNGIRADEAITYAVAQGVDVVVTDHHEPGEVLPSAALAIVHWARSANADELRLLSGAGVAWKLCSALLSAASVENAQVLADWHTGLAALGALADVMPMRGENRKLVKAGVDILRRCQRPGWLALCESAGVHRTEFTDTGALWSITPRLNAAGRMGTAEVAFALLMADSMETAQPLAQQIEEWNQQRKADTERVYEEAKAQYESVDEGGEWPVILVAGPWHLGVAGIVAAKLVSAYRRPAIVLADDGTGLLRGSGRAPDGYPLHAAVQACEHELVHFGGHETAIGCAVSSDRLESFRSALLAAGAAYVQGDGAADGVNPLADDYLPLTEVTLETARWVDRLAPFGPDNPPLTFYIGPVEVTGVTLLSNGRHAKIRVREGRNEAELLWFQIPDEVKTWEKGRSIAAIAVLETNVWRGTERVQLRVQEAFTLRSPLLRDDFGDIYRLLRARRKLSQADIVTSAPDRVASVASTVLDTFVDLGFATFIDSAYHVVDSATPRDLRESRSYQRYLQSIARVAGDE